MKPSPLVTSGGVRRHTVRGMRKITKAALVGGAAAAAIAATVGVGMGVAQAEPDYTTYGSRGDQSGWAYASELIDQRMLTSSPQATQLGWNVCNQLTMTGMTEPQLRHSWEDQGYSIHTTVAIVAGATYHFCPWNEEIPAPAPPAPAPQLKRAL